MSVSNKPPVEERLKLPVKEYEGNRGSLDPHNPPKVSNLPQLRGIMGRHGEDEILAKFTPITELGMSKEEWSSA
jgi:hypothetical protein